MNGLNMPTGYTVQNVCGCRIVTGEVPLRELAALTTGFSKKAVFDVAFATRIGASLVIGEPEDLEKLHAYGLPVAPAITKEAEHAAAKGFHAAASWLLNGDRGASSNAMCRHLFKLGAPAGRSLPYDPSDLRRCVELLDATGAHDKIAEMRSVSPEWARLVDAWDDLTALLREELAGGTRAPKTYAKMKEVLRD